MRVTREKTTVDAATDARLNGYLALERKWLIEDFRKLPPDIVLVDNLRDGWGDWARADAEAVAASQAVFAGTFGRGDRHPAPDRMIRAALFLHDADRERIGQARQVFADGELHLSKRVAEALCCSRPRRG